MAGKQSHDSKMPDLGWDATEEIETLEQRGQDNTHNDRKHKRDR